VPNHLTGRGPDSVVAADEVAQVHGRSMLVKRLQPLPIEAVVRGYLAGSGWKEYQEGGASAACRCRPACSWPAAAAADLHAGHQGRGRCARREHQLRADRGADRPERAAQVRDVAIRLYTEAARYALTRGIVIADTKFEFGLDEHGTLTLMDEVLTPDSSRFWPLARGAKARTRPASTSSTCATGSRPPGERPALEQAGAGAGAAGGGGAGHRRALPAAAAQLTGR
jgi:phosphoribosylaminoimidazole-succinocarboxamide synthase